MLSSAGIVEPLMALCCVSVFAYIGTTSATRYMQINVVCVSVCV